MNMKMIVNCLFFYIAIAFQHRTLNDKGYRVFLSRNAVPREVMFQPGEVEIVQFLGKIDLQMDSKNLELLKREIESLGDDEILNSFMKQIPAEGSNARLTSVRVFEAIIPGLNRCFVKEYLPVGAVYGKTELVATKRLTEKFNDMLADRDISDFPLPPFPILFGFLRTDKRIEDPAFKAMWMQRFPRTAPPVKGNLWLLFRWDSSSFKSLKSFPPLPQIVAGADYFNKDSRDGKRWRFIRKVMKKVLEALEFFHRNGYCHNSISTESIWITTTNQLDVDLVQARLADLGTAQSFASLGSYAREAAMEDLYQVGLSFLELVISSFSEETSGAVSARAALIGKTTSFEVMKRVCTFLISVQTIIITFVYMLSVMGFADE